LGRIFVCLWLCSNGRIAGYATIATQPKADKKTRKMGGLFVASCLSNNNWCDGVKTIINNDAGDVGGYYRIMEKIALK